MNLAEYPTTDPSVTGRLNRIADATPISAITPSEWERRVTTAALAAGISAEDVEWFLTGGDL